MQIISGEILDINFSSSNNEQMEINMVLTNEDLLRDVVAMLANRNSYLQIDATAGVCNSAGGINEKNLFLYVLIVGVPTKSNGPDYFRHFATFVSSNQHAINLDTMLGLFIFFLN